MKLASMSDVYDEECEQIKKDFPDDPDAINWEENHVFIDSDVVRCGMLVKLKDVLITR